MSNRRLLIFDIIGKIDKQKILKHFISFICYICATIISICLVDSGIPVDLGNVTFEITFKDIPLILLTGLHGYFWGILLVYTIFIYKAISDTRYLYMMFIFTATVFAIGYMSSHRWFLKRTVALIGALITAFNLGPLWWFLVCRIRNIQLLRPMSETYALYMIGALPEALISFALLHQIFKYLPDFLKSKIPYGVYYTNKDYQTIQKSTISTHLTTLIALDCIIFSFGAAFASAFLIPSIEPDVIVPSEKAGAVSGILDVLDISSDRAGYNDDDINNAELYDNGATFNLSNVLEPTSYNTFVYNRNGIAYNIRLIMFIMNIAIPTGIFTNYFSQKRIAAPIVRLTKATSDFVDDSYDNEVTGSEIRSDIKGEYDHNIVEKVNAIHELNIDTGNEVEGLYHSIEKTTEYLVNYVNSMRQEQKLKEDLRVATQANVAKNSFLSNMSHELRTPINVILGMDEMILREYDNDENLTLYALSIQSSGRTLLSLVNDILDFSKIEAGKMEIIPVEYDIGSMIVDLYNMISIRAQEKHLDFIIHVDPNIPNTLYGDDIRIKQCIVNILTNAVKYTNEGSVTLYIDYEEADTENITLKIRIKDTGIGMKEEEMSRLYTPFERMDEIKNRTVEGTGLGISIVQNLLRMMDSHIEVSSQYGVGSEFYFAIKQRVISNEPVGDIAQSFKKNVSSHKKYHTAFHAPDAKILVVDDTAMNLTVIVGLLKDTQITVDTASSGAQCLEMAQKSPYDIIFIDHRMPEMDGVETLHRLRNMGERNLSINAPCIALTANAIAGAREEYLEAGFSDYLSKPVDTLKLEKMLIDYLPAKYVHMFGTPEYAADIQDMKKDPVKASDTDETEYIIINGRKYPLKDLKSLGASAGIDIEVAIQNCGSPDILLKVIKDFYSSIKDKGKLIEEYAKAKDYENYTIQVHSLKSSSRLIGALKLSKDAEYLEKCGDEKNESEIVAKTPQLLALFYGYKDKLSPILNEENSDNPDNNELPLISDKELKEYKDGIRELVEAFDFDSADAAINELYENYQIPEESKELLEKIRIMLQAVNRDGILKILQK
ncbi:MAG: response regulator [Butyrivibrio sp.]|jgi:signal transduction histidine kinase/DNA-binding NarL/FixJ family response regulator/HPt (histidine-containing phosphotransfer) domain-containing protein|nr:response regulator [Butyrivibrio sp.]MCR4637457.1 response regulator [Butyrivibrio sp.]